MQNQGISFHSSIQQGLHDWAKSTPFAFVAVLNFRHAVSEEVARRTFRVFLAHLDRRLYRGKHGDRRIYVWPILEHSQAGNLHYHIFLSRPEPATSRGRTDDEIVKIVIATWERLEKAATPLSHGVPRNWCQVLRNRPGAERYHTKTAMRDVDCLDLDNLRLVGMA